MKYFIGIFLLISLFFFPSGCKKKEPPASEEIRTAESVSESNFTPAAADDSKSASDENAAESRNAPETDSSPKPDGESARRTVSPAQNLSRQQTSRSASPSDRIDDMFIYKITRKRIVPEDFLIGPLENLQSSDYRVSLILKTLNTFFRDLRIGTFNEDCIHPSAVLLLSSSFRFYLEEDAVPDVVRIGKAEPNGKSVRVNLRFYRGNGVTDGEVILEETNEDKGKKWLITDFQADLMKLLDPYKPSEEPFEPGAYNFYNWE